MKAARAIGARRVFRYLLWSLLYGLGFRFLLFSPLRVVWLRVAGATLGPGCVLMDVRFFNIDRGGMRNLHLGRDVFVGDECLLDMAGRISLGDQVTLAERVMVLTHVNVGYADHPLQEAFPSKVASVRIGAGCYIGAGTVILPGVSIGPSTAVGAGAVVTHDLDGGVLAVGVPARPIRSLGRRCEPPR